MENAPDTSTPSVSASLYTTTNASTVEADSTVKSELGDSILILENPTSEESSFNRDTLNPSYISSRNSVDVCNVSTSLRCDSSEKKSEQNVNDGSHSVYIEDSLEGFNPSSEEESELDLEEEAEEAAETNSSVLETSSLTLPDTVTVLTTPDGGCVYLVGTAHFSKESQEDVAKVIQAVQPHVVLVELCKARVNILQLDEQTILEEAKNINFEKIKSTIQQNGLFHGIMNILLLSMSAHLTKELGMAPGGEFRRAFSEAKKVPHCVVHLGDRPIKLTLQRALASLSWWQTMKLTWHIMSKESISKEEVERCKQRDLLEEMLAQLTGEFPAFSRVFVAERDLYLANSLQLAALPIPYPSAPMGYIPAKVVGVVGIGHVPGIIQHWGKVDQDAIPAIMEIPPPSLTSRVIKLTVKASLLGILVWGCVRILPLPHFSREIARGAENSLRTIKATVHGLFQMCKDQDFINNVEPRSISCKLSKGLCLPNNEIINALGRDGEENEKQRSGKKPSGMKENVVEESCIMGLGNLNFKRCGNGERDEERKREKKQDGEKRGDEEVFGDGVGGVEESDGNVGGTAGGGDDERDGERKDDREKDKKNEEAEIEEEEDDDECERSERKSEGGDNSSWAREMLDDYDHSVPGVFYVPTNIPGPGACMDDFESVFDGCGCSSDSNDACFNSGKKCSCIARSLGHNYDNKGLLLWEKLSGSLPVFECTSFCSCNSKCGNRRVQFGPLPYLRIFEVNPLDFQEEKCLPLDKKDVSVKNTVAKGKGLGLKTLRHIQRGTFICEYAGEVIGKQEALRRWKSDSLLGLPNYILTLCEWCPRLHGNDSSELMTLEVGKDGHACNKDGRTIEGVNNGRCVVTYIDPTRLGNIGRYANHSCDPNSAAVAVRANYAVPLLSLFALKDIMPGDEITFDYAGLNKISGSCNGADNSSQLHRIELFENFLPVAENAASGESITLGKHYLEKLPVIEDQTEALRFSAPVMECAYASGSNFIKSTVADHISDSPLKKARDHYINVDNKSLSEVPNPSDGKFLCKAVCPKEADKELQSLNQIFHINRTPCLCGTKNCRKYLPFSDCWI